MRTNLPILAALLVQALQCPTLAYEDSPRFFTNGHGGNQFFHATQHHHQEELGLTRRMDTDSSFSDNVNYVVKAPTSNNHDHNHSNTTNNNNNNNNNKKNNNNNHNDSNLTMSRNNIKRVMNASHRLEFHPENETKPDDPQTSNGPVGKAENSPQKSFSKRILNEDNVSAESAENQILPVKSTTTPKMGSKVRPTRRPFFRRITTPSSAKPATSSTSSSSNLFTRKRIFVRKFMPQVQHLKQPEKNKKREISTSSSNAFSPQANNKFKYKFTNANRHFKPKPNNAQFAHNNRSLLYTRKPSGKIAHMHFRKLELASTTTEATTSATMQRMKEKRHLANIRFFNRRKLKS